MITKLEAACASAESDVPLEVAARVLALPLERGAFETRPTRGCKHVDAG